MEGGKPGLITNDEHLALGNCKKTLILEGDNWGVNTG